MRAQSVGQVGNLPHRLRSPAAIPQLAFDCGNTLAGLAGTAIACPPVDGRLLDPSFTHLTRTGFLDGPRRNGARRDSKAWWACQ
jgi:hypothetical protein